MNMNVKDFTIELLLRYGFQVLGALAILAVGFLAAKWLGGMADHRFQKQHMEPPMRHLFVRVIKLLVVVMAGVVALDKFGFSIAPLVAGIGVAGLGVGFAMQGVLGNLMAGLTIIFTKPFRVGEYIEINQEKGDVSMITLSSTILTHPDHSRVIIPNRKIVGEILHNFGTMRQLHLAVHVPHHADLNQALEACRQIVDANIRVLKDPPPASASAQWRRAGSSSPWSPGCAWWTWCRPRPRSIRASSRPFGRGESASPSPPTRSACS